jgi:hypothetical protein
MISRRRDVERAGEKRNAYKDLAGELKGKSLLQSPQILLKTGNEQENESL